MKYRISNVRQQKWISFRFQSDINLKSEKSNNKISIIRRNFHDFLWFFREINHLDVIDFQEKWQLSDIWWHDGIDMYNNTLFWIQLVIRLFHETNISQVENGSWLIVCMDTFVSHCIYSCYIPYRKRILMCENSFLNKILS